MLISKAPGTQLSGYNWRSESIGGPPNPSRRSRNLRTITEDGKAKIMRQLRHLAHDLSNLRFDKIGSLFEDDEKGYVVKEGHAPAYVFEDRNPFDLDRGPFDDELIYYESLTAASKMQAESLSMTAHLFLAPTL